MRSTPQPVALITGASRGIGAATARELARRGYALALSARGAAGLEALAGQLAQAGIPALPIPADLQQPEQARRLGQLALEHFGRVDVLVNNAGIGGRRRPVAQFEDDDVQAMLDINLVAPIMLTRVLLPGMLEQRRGAIIFNASVSAHIALPNSAIYATSKAALRSFAIALRREVGSQGVGVTVVSPGFIDTDMTRRLPRILKTPPERVARVIADAIDRPRREVIVPGYYWPFVKLEDTLPGLLDLGLRLVGRVMR